jgi:hypothetical protein
MNASDPNPSGNPEKRDVTGFLKALLLGGALAVSAPRSEAAISVAKVEGGPSGDLTLRLANARALLASHEHNGPSALIPGTPGVDSPDILWWRNWGNWRPGWGNARRSWGNFRPAWGNGGWGNGGWHNWRNF